jgi:thiol-disulfide isomerase/thioredoxin
MTFDASVSTFRYAPIKGSALNDLAQELANAQKGTSRPEQLQLEAEFIKEHPESIISARTLSIYASTWGKSKTSVLFENFSAENKETHYGKKISKYLKYAQELKVGDRFVDFTMNDPDGNSIAFSEVHGKYILLEFWSSHCGPCRVENPTLVQTYQKYQPKGFEIVGVSLDKQMAHWTKAIELLLTVTCEVRN